MKYCINIDWLQVYCHDYNTLPLDKLYNGKSEYEFVLQEYSSRHFKQIWRVVDADGDDYAIIQRHPCSTILSRDAAIIQLNNRELYKSLFASRFLLFLREHQFTYKSLSRLDVCLDSNTLYKGRPYASFIRSIMNSRYLKNNQAKVKWSFSSMADVGRPMCCNSCSFGSRTSSVSAKMYNKSLELREVKNKPYIIENWRFNGLNTDEDVWRIEFTIKSDAATTVKTSTGEIFKLNLNILEFQDQIEDIFFSYAKKYFDFKINDGTKNKSRMTSLQLFPSERVTTMRPMKITDCKDANRADRIFLKKLHHLLDELNNLDATTEEAIWKVSDAFVLCKSLSEWRKGRILSDDRNPTTSRDSAFTLIHRLRTLMRDIRYLFPWDGADIVREMESIINNLKTLKQ